MNAGSAQTMVCWGEVEELDVKQSDGKGFDRRLRGSSSWCDVVGDGVSDECRVGANDGVLGRG